MSASLYEDRMVTNRKPAWWDYEGAHVFEDEIELVEAGALAGVYFDLVKMPLHSYSPAYKSPATGLWVPGMPVVEIPNRMGLWRAPTPMMAGPGRVKLGPNGKPEMSPAAYLRDVGADYPLWQNRAICEALNPISKRWPVESIGALDNGATLITSLNMGGSKLAGEDYSNLFGLIEDRNGSALVSMFTKVRMVCKNTAIAALDAADFVIRVPHGKNFLQEADAALQIMTRAEVVMHEFDALAEEMTRVPLYRKQVTDILERIWPEPEKPALVQKAESLAERSVRTDDLDKIVAAKKRDWETEVRRMERHRLLAVECLDRIADESPLGNSAWAVYQAVIETADHEKGRGDRALSALVGDRARAKNEALQLLADLVN